MDTTVMRQKLGHLMKEAQNRRALQTGLRDFLVPVHVDLGTTNMTLGQVDNLQSGETVVLDQFAHEDVAVKVGETTIAYARIFEVDGEYAAQITTMENTK